MKRFLKFITPWPVTVLVSFFAWMNPVADAEELSHGLPSAQTLKALELLHADAAALVSRKVRRIALGEIRLPTGRIVAVDPLTLFGAERSFTTVVKPGTYPVHVYAQDTGGGDIRIGLAELRFSDVKPSIWTMALTDGQDVSALKADELFGYGVDAGLGSFMSPETVAALVADMKRAEETIPNFSDYYTNVLAKDLDKPTPNAIVYPVPSSPENKLAIFHSGWGDGFYPSYFGFDTDGQPVTLVTTFFVLEDES
jgi:Protein of unknown function (DUF4241)